MIENQSRTAFERWMKDAHPDIPLDREPEGHYKWKDASDFYRAWEAGRELGAAGAQDRSVER